MLILPIILSRHKEYSALIAKAAKKNGKKLSSELELELRNGQPDGQEVGDKKVVDEEGDVETKEVAELGIKDLFGKELWLITTVMWLAWPVGELSFL